MTSGGELDWMDVVRPRLKLQLSLFVVIQRHVILGQPGLALTVLKQQKSDLLFCSARTKMGKGGRRWRFGIERV